MQSLEEKQNIEIEFWRNAEHEAPGTNSLYNMVDKISDARILLDCLDRHQAILNYHGKILELGSGQGWASCLYKRLFPEVHITATDISKFAIMSLPKWERLFETRVDNSYACTSYNCREADNSIDQIFCFAAAHHFLAHRKTLQEIARVLKPNGRAFYFYEPATPPYLYRPALWKVNKKRPHVPEDVLISAKLSKIAKEVGLDISIDYYPSLLKRDKFEMAYFFLLDCVPYLQKIFPCTVNYIFTKT